MTDRLAVVTRLALVALAQFYAAGKVTIIEMFTEHAPAAGESPRQSQVVNVDVTGRPELRDQLADAIISCDVYHVHEPSCYPWEVWTTDGGTNYRGLLGQLLTMWIRIEELTGYTPRPAASDPAAVPDVQPSGWLDTGNGWGYDVPPPRPPVSAAFPSFAEWKRGNRPIDLSGAVGYGSLGIARVDGGLTPGPVKADLTEHPFAVLLDEHERHGEDTASLVAEYGDRPDVVVVPGAAADTPPSMAWRKWAMAAIEQDARTGGPYPDYASALAAVRLHPAVKSIEPQDVVNLAYALVTPPSRNRGPWWSLRGMLRPGVAK